MTYCVGISVDQGIVFVSDSRTNAGSDNISSYSKMYSFGVPGERQIVVCCAGNLATTQAVMLAVEKDIEGSAKTNLMNIKRISEAATYIGKLIVAQQKLTDGSSVFRASFLVGGEIGGARCRLFLVYPEGNFIASSDQSPFLQLGEAKYGKPILDRVINQHTTLEASAMAALISMDATTRSNLTVGPPIELSIYAGGSLQPPRYIKFDESDYLKNLGEVWNTALTNALGTLPPIPW